jgi:hypothetical protein
VELSSTIETQNEFYIVDFNMRQVYGAIWLNAALPHVGPGPQGLEVLTMLIMLQNSYLSVAQHPNHPDKLAVHSTIPGDIEQVFPAAQVAEDAKNGTYRAVVSKAEMQAAMSAQIAKIDYTSLGGAVRGELRSGAYDSATGGRDAHHERQESCSS